MYGIHYFCNCYCLLYICRIDCYGYIDLNYLLTAIVRTGRELGFGLTTA